METALKYYFKYVPKYYFISSLVQTVVVALLSLGDSVLVPSIVAAYFAETVEINVVIIAILSLLFVNIAYVCIIKIIEHRTVPKLNRDFSKGINMLLFTKMNSISLHYYDNPDFYDKYNLAKQNTLPSIYASAGLILNTVSQIVSIGAMLTLIALIDPVILLFMIACAVISVVIQIMISVVSLKMQKESVGIKHIFEYVARTFYLKRYALDQRYTDIADVNLGLYRSTIGRVDGLIKKMLKKVMPLDCLDASVTDVLIYFSILIFSCYRITVLNQYSAGELVAVLTSSIALFGHLSGVGSLLTQLVDINKRMGFFNDFMAYPDNHVAENQVDKCSLSKEIVVDDLCFSYGDKQVLHDISLRIPAGSAVALIGPNGAGKSTLVKILQGLYNDYSGHVIYDETDISDLSEQSFSELFMVVNQVPVIYEMTIAENILLRPCETDDDKAAVWDLLQKVGLKDKIAQYKDGINTVIGNEFHTDGIQLSGGEAQKIAIARSLFNKKKILVLDEPSSHLDPLSERQLFDLFASLKNELTFIVITHNIHNIIDTDQIVWLEDGKVEESGTHEQLLKLGKKYAEAYNSLYNTLR